MRTIKYMVIDVDGTLTDGKIYYGNSGEIFKVFDIKDGYGIRNILCCNKITPIVITGRSSQIVKLRCDELGIRYLYQGISNKMEVLHRFRECNEAKWSEFAYIGDDLNDLACMQVIKNGGGIVGCPANAIKGIIEYSDFVSHYNGGDGAVREFIEYLLEQ